jgi:crotonobetainyl-CoA:carnitine CoA-transferase CaiB-like acyl-CoA transferase
VHCVSERQFEAVYGFIGNPELARDPRFASPLDRAAHIDELMAIVEAFFAAHDATFIYREGQKRGIPMVPIPTLVQIPRMGTA